MPARTLLSAPIGRRFEVCRRRSQHGAWKRHEKGWQLCDARELFRAPERRPGRRSGRCSGHPPSAGRRILIATQLITRNVVPSRFQRAFNSLRNRAVDDQPGSPYGAAAAARRTVAPRRLSLRIELDSALKVIVFEHDLARKVFNFSRACLVNR
jgi:hypothetical protein